MWKAVFAALLGLASASALTSVSAAQTPARAAEDQVIATERDFAADALKRGVGPSFVTWAAPDGVILNPDPSNARAVYGAKPANPSAPPLKWWPVHAGVSAGGDLAFDTGPWVYGDDKAHGWFLTIWKRQPDGTWRWVLDHGMDSVPSRLGPTTPVSRLAPRIGRGDAESALHEIIGEDAALAAATAQGKLAEAYRERMGDGIWIGGLEPEPQTTRAEVLAALEKRPQTIRTESLGGGTARLGDMAYTYGKAYWTGADGKPAEGRYVRVWQLQGGHWRIVMDAITPL